MSLTVHLLICLERVQDLQLPPAFCIPSSEPIARAIEQAYERDFSHIPSVSLARFFACVLTLEFGCSVLNSKRRPLGYIDVAALKAKWEAGVADPVSLLFI